MLYNTYYILYIYIHTHTYRERYAICYIRASALNAGGRGAGYHTILYYIILQCHTITIM